MRYSLRVTSVAFFHRGKSTARCGEDSSSKSLLSCLSGFSEKRLDVSFQDGFHVLFGFFEIPSPHPDGQAFTNAFPTSIFRPKHTLHGNGSDQRYFYSATPHDLVLSSTETQVASRMPILGASNSFRITHSTARVRPLGCSL